MTGNSLIDVILSDALWMLGAIGVLLALVAGALLLFAPGLALRTGDRLNREWSFGWLKRALDEPRRSEPFIYRHHRIVGFMLVVATLYVFWSMTAGGYSAAGVVALYEGTMPLVVLEILANTLTVVLVIGSALGFALGAIMLVRPSLLKSVEAASNRWVDTDRASEVLNRRDDRPESAVHRHPRRIGVIIVVAALYVVAMAWFAL